MIDRAEIRTANFFKTIQAGDIALFELFQEAVAMFGFTKMGKTSSGHFLANSPMRAEKSNGDLVYRPTTQKFINAKIGFKTESETEIPNIFQIPIKDKDSKDLKIKKIALLDQPGYGDSYGFHRIFSNGYFHYRTFSKTPKLKFILAIDKLSLTGTAQKFRRTIFNFVNTFVDFSKIYKDILAATSVLITKVDIGINIDNIRNILLNLRQSVQNMSSNQIKNYQLIIDDILSKNKLFIIEKPRNVGDQTRQNTLFKQMYQKTTFWVRQKVTNYSVDMKDINFSVANQILSNLSSFKDNEVFREDFDIFIQQMSKRIKSILIKDENSFVNVVKRLKQDAKKQSNSHQFLELMVKFNQNYYVFQPNYKDKRQERQISLFKSAQNFENSNSSSANLQSPSGKINLSNSAEKIEKEKIKQKEKERERGQMYFIKKFNVLEFIHTNVKTFIQQNQFIDRKVVYLQQVSQLMKQIFKKFDILRVQKQDSTKIIYKYSYIIQRLIEESKIMTLILFSNKKAQGKFDQILKTEFQPPRSIVDANIVRLLNDQIFTELDVDVGQMKRQYIENLNFKEINIVTKDSIKFFEDVKFLSQNTKIKISLLILKYSEICLTKNNISIQEHKYIAKKLLDYRNRFYSLLKISKAEKAKKSQIQSYIEHIFSITKSLGLVFAKLNQFDLAREIYKTINNAESIFNIFELQIKGAGNNQKLQRKLLLEYGKYAFEVRRKELAMKCYQRAYEASDCYAQLKEVGQCILNLEKDEDKKQYLKTFYNEQYCKQIPSNIVANIISALPEEQTVLTGLN